MWPEFRVITLSSDFQADLQVVRQNFVKSQLVLDTVTVLNQVARNNIIHLRWVKGHCGIISNERANVLAKEGTSDPQREATQFPKSPPIIIKAFQHEGLDSRWNKYWQSFSDCYQTKQLFLPFAKRLLLN